MTQNPHRVLEPGQLRQLNPRDYGAGQYFVLGTKGKERALNSIGELDHYWTVIYDGKLVEFMGTTIQFDSRLVTQERPDPYGS